MATYAKAPEALVAALAKNGDRLAFEELVRRRQSWLRNLMRRLCGDPALADDLAQQAFLEAWRHMGKLRQPGSFGAWLKRLAVNVWLQHCRRRDPLKNAGDPDEIAGQAEHSADLAYDLDRALAGLSEPVRLCIVLSYSEGMSHAEIAELTGLPAGTVKSHIRRGAQRLKKALSAYGGTTSHGEHS
ncbi:RNA polymerase sigma factor [Hoeflea prorocentri]|uniref:Sigma-70 family RNA polymerase sigma factor n=1 Tax=Hoeflea prorocentri TaxID=1922333 RepID=A0A9X3UJZ5_9HYPH|nr:sigma-70 family RNA polymerase sigma factor [Hoeflea prorocentri]MCY6381971.1 sigma-70 family RNA polymerase sigma factor [Hoeflea prorocentri]MDA5399771.1 sigma-70 family RNA polymerase sigma factor [Hoeflea prorocentri]